jgi:hypothetical protein
VEKLMKIEGHRNQSAMDCSVKFKNIKRHYLKLSVLRKTKTKLKNPEKAIRSGLSGHSCKVWKYC